MRHEGHLDGHYALYPVPPSSSPLVSDSLPHRGAVIRLLTNAGVPHDDDGADEDITRMDQTNPNDDYQLWGSQHLPQTLYALVTFLVTH